MPGKLPKELLSKMTPSEKKRHDSRVKKIQALLKQGKDDLTKINKRNKTKK